MFLTLFCNYPTPLCTLVEDFKISYMYRDKKTVNIYKILLLTKDIPLTRHKGRLIKVWYQRRIAGWPLAVAWQWRHRI